MKIIKEGKIKIKERYKKCHICQCEFIYDCIKDREYGTIDGYEKHDCVKCPTCGVLMPMSIFDKRVKEKNTKYNINKNKDCNISINENGGKENNGIR